MHIKIIKRDWSGSHSLLKKQVSHLLCMSLFDHCWWFFLCCLIILVVISFYGTTSVIVITSVYFHNLFFFHLFFPRCNCWLAFKLRAWSTSIIFYDLYWCRWICFVKNFLWYKRYYNWSFNVSLRSSFLYSLISSPSFSHLKSVLTHFNNFFCK